MNFSLVNIADNPEKVQYILLNIVMWWSSGKDKQTELGDNGLVVLIEFEMLFEEGILIRQIFSNVLRVFRWEFWQFCLRLARLKRKLEYLCITLLKDSNLIHN